MINDRSVTDVRREKKGVRWRLVITAETGWRESDKPVSEACSMRFSLLFFSNSILIMKRINI